MNEVSLRKYESDFGNLRFNLLGFEDLFNGINTLAPPTYPPVNVIKKTDDEYTIEVACAGFSLEELEITVANGQLAISGSRETDQSDGQYLVKGIASRSFRRQWTLAEHVKVTNAELINGILSVELSREVPEEKRLQKISITSNR